jgi:hypothetical protein
MSRLGLATIRQGGERFLTRYPTDVDIKPWAFRKTPRARLVGRWRVARNNNERDVRSA